MRNISIITTIMFLILFGTTQAQTIDSGKNNYLVLSKNIQQLKPVMLTAAQLAKEDGDNYGEFYVIFCGKTVQDMSKSKEFISLATEAKKQHIKVFACGLSLKKFGINPMDLPHAIEITKNGILYGFQLTKKGFITLTI